MASATNGTASVAYTYDSEGLRLTKATGDLVYHYYYAGGKLVRIHLYKGSTFWQIFDFFYDQNGHPYALNHKVGGVYTTYYYLTNLQGDVLGMVKADGTTVATYTYDPYGKPLTATGTFAATNPLRYRGYCYDTETGLYYLHSRYYDPTTARFLNADTFASTGQGILGNNMFAYCLNNPTNFGDPSGTASKIIFGDGFDLLDRPWKDPTTGGGHSACEIYYTPKQKDNLEEQEALLALNTNGYAIYKGVLVIKSDNPWGSFSCGFILLNSKTIANPALAMNTLKHEYGHFLHLQDIGTPKYIRKVVIPSATGATLKHLGLLNMNYYDLPWEQIAEQYGEVERGGYASWAKAAATFYWIYTLI